MRARPLILAAIALSLASAGLSAPSSADVASAPARAAQAVPAPGWQIEQITAGAVVGPEDLSLDAVGHAMVTWLGGRQTATESLYFGADVREPGGGWHQVANPPLQSSTTHMYLYGNGLAQQIGRVLNLSQRRNEVLAADGSISGIFVTPRVLSSTGELERPFPVVSAADAAGDAIVAWLKPRGHGHGIVVAERTRGRPFSSPRTLIAEGVPVAVGLTPRGERVLVWSYGKALYARIRRPGRPWGPARLAMPSPPSSNPAVSVAISPSGTVVLAWEAAVFPCEGCCCPPELRAVVAVSGAHRSWRSFTLERPAAASYLSPRIVALDDTTGRMYVTWNGARHGTPVVKFARIGTHGVGPTTVLSTGVSGGTLLDAAAGPRNALAVSWGGAQFYYSVNRPVYVSLRRNGQPFAAPVQVISGNVHAGSGLVAFQPVTGQAVVVSTGPSGTQAAISPPG